ncbi:anhydro-N-acetylmuramic acid kinase [Methylobacterium oryzae CBMB20]
MAMMRAIGLMSGTSLDGVDIALIETDGEQVHVVKGHNNFPGAAGPDSATAATPTTRRRCWRGHQGRRIRAPSRRPARAASRRPRPSSPSPTPRPWSASWRSTA